METDGRGLIGKYVGETGPKTQAKVNEAMNGILFIDEAYSLAGSNDASGGATRLGLEAIAVLLKEMEDRRGQFCVILAGYRDEMKNVLSPILVLNQGYNLHWISRIILVKNWA